MTNPDLSQQSDSQRFYRAIGWRLAVTRQLEGLDVKQAARKAGVDPRSWRRWESGVPITTMPVLKICEAFELGIDWLLSGKRDDDMPDGPDGGGRLPIDIAA